MEQSLFSGALLTANITDAEAREITQGYIELLPSSDSKTATGLVLVNRTGLSVFMFKDNTGLHLLNVNTKTEYKSIDTLLTNDLTISVLQRYTTAQPLVIGEGFDEWENVFLRQLHTTIPAPINIQGQREVKLINLDNENGLLETFGGSRKNVKLFSCEVKKINGAWIRHGIEQRWYVRRQPGTDELPQPVVFYYWLNGERVDERTYNKQISQEMNDILLPDINMMIGKYMLPK